MIAAKLDPIAFSYQKDAFFEDGQYDQPRTKGKALSQLVGLYHALLDEQVHAFKTNHKYKKKIRPQRRDIVRSEIKNHILPFLGDMVVTKIEPADVEDLLDNLAQKMSPQSANKVLSTLRRMMTLLRKKRIIKANPCSDVDHLPASEPPCRYTPVKAEVEKVLGSFTNISHQAMVRLAAETGLRISEILALTFDNVHGNKLDIAHSAVNAVIGPPKTAESKRKVIISNALKLRLAELELQSTGAFIFTNSNGKLYTATNSIKSVLYPACDRANVPRFGWHGLRRFYRNEQEDQGISKDHIQKMMGHKIGSAVTDKHYRVVREEDVLKDDYVIHIK